MRYDALIIGAGLSGLGAGIRLAQFGKRVAILEKHTLWGGLNSFYKLGGRRFDSGLHALTNYAPRGERTKPLGRILRQLRIDHDELALGEQSWSAVRFPGIELRFSNDLALLRSEIARAFPGEVAAFERLLADLPGYERLDGTNSGRSARAELSGRFRDPLLVEMLLCPLCYYGGAREHDLDWEPFAILFRAVFLEGFARPSGGIRPVLDVLVKRFKAEGGELRLRAGVARIVVEGGAERGADRELGRGRVRGVVLESGEELEAEHVYSSAGWVETLALCPREHLRGAGPIEPGPLSFFESLTVTAEEPRALGFDGTAIFFNDSPRFDYRSPDGLVDPRSGVICTPNNYATSEPLTEGLLRVTLLASHAHWRALDPERYVAEKARAAELALAAAARFAFDVRGKAIFQDTFTPLTIERFTGHVGGAVYGSAHKRPDGKTGIDGLSLIGTDQGFVGIVGALLSGITVVNRRELEAAGSAS
ncbi:MAG: NAD(P)/FAD-dependent oxidoreductase [Planctomycetes bacterium]|nr:NAD(P)/FAD-dependent oxidoreductase [Planctomycetota bacterium]